MMMPTSDSHSTRPPRAYAVTALSVLMLLWPVGFNSADESVRETVSGRTTPETVQDRQKLEFFESRIRPVLIQHCYKCHSNETAKSEGGLRVDSRDALLAGGDSGAAVVVGEAAGSLIIEALKHLSLQMPPDERLNDAIIRDFEQWINDGLVDPRHGKVEAKTSSVDLDKGRKFWSFRPVQRPPVPDLNSDSRAWSRTDIDAFVAAGHEKNGVKPGQDATPEELIRRLAFVLAGLPPTPDQIDTFVAAWNIDPEQAMEQTIDHMLASPRFGERWGRHWLDVARFAESSGGGRSLMYPHAWRYRDYVIRSFNDDKPFDQFVREQIAGDLLPASTDKQRDDQVTGSGYLIMGAINFEQQDKESLRMDVIDEQVHAVGRTFMGMTLGCARCHDHKFDPIPASDYYALAGIFRSTHTLTPGNVSGYVTTELRTGFDPAQLELWQQKEKKLKDGIAALDQQTNTRAKLRNGIALDSLQGVVVDDSAAEFQGEWQQSAIQPPFVGAGYHHSGHDRTGIQVRYSAMLPTEGRWAVRMAHNFSPSRSASVPVTVHHADGSTEVRINQQLAPNADGVFTKLGEYEFTANSPAVVVVDVSGASDGYVIADAVQFLPVDTVANVKSPGDDELRSKKSLISAEEQADRETRLKSLRAELAAHMKLKPELPLAMCVEDESQPADWHLHLRGDPHRLGPVIPRGFLTVATPVNHCRQVETDKGAEGATLAAVAEIPSDQSGRLQLAEWLSSEDNPLTARVFVNRVWMHVMGEGLVRDPDNFGTTGQPPTHPELLDFLAHSFMHDDGWAPRKLIRRMCLSRTFRMSSVVEASRSADPGNMLLTRGFQRRIDAEMLRDSVLMISGQLDLTVTSGRTIGRLSTYDNGYVHDDHPVNARSVFVPFFRNAMLDLFFVFDIANPNTVTGRRTSGTLPAQSLYLMNSPFISQQSRLSAERFLQTVSVDDLREDQSLERLLDDAFRLTVARNATQEERSVLMEHLKHCGPDSVEAWSEVFHAIFGSTDFRFID
ncbi:MAG: DUF1549 domain-containing protein [Planctomycetaceae bacterium]